MIRHILKAGLVLLSLLLAVGAQAETRQIDAANSSLGWQGTKAVGGGHVGSIAVKSGTVTLEGGKPVAAEIVVDMTTIVNFDVESPEWNAKLVNHLNSDDFFGVANHPEARLVLSTFTPRGGGYDVEGELTIKGVTEPVAFAAMEAGDVVEARLVFDRTLFGIKFRSSNFFENLAGDKIINDEIAIEAKIKLAKAT